MSRNSMGPLIFVNSTLDSQKYKDILEGSLLPFARIRCPVMVVVAGQCSHLQKSAYDGSGWMIFKWDTRSATWMISHKWNFFDQSSSFVTRSERYRKSLVASKKQINKEAIFDKAGVWYHLQAIWKRIGPPTLCALVDLMLTV